MARTIRRQSDRDDARIYYPSKRARKIEKRQDRQATRLHLQEYAR